MRHLFKYCILLNNGGSGDIKGQEIEHFQHLIYKMAQFLLDEVDIGGWVLTPVNI